MQLARSPNTSNINLRGGELRVENSEVINTNRLNDAATVTLGGGALRITGQETLGAVSAVAGTTIVVNNPISETVASALSLTGFSRSLGAIVQFQQPDIGGAAGSSTFAQSRVSGRIVIPGFANTTQTIPGFLANNNLDFVQYDGTTIDNGALLGVREMRNPGSANSPQNYTNDPAETAWNDNVIARLTNGTDNTTVTTTLTASRGIDAIKIEAGGTNRIRNIDVGANQLRIESGGILAVTATGTASTILGAGSLTAGTAAPGATPAELILGGNSPISINTAIVNNGTQAVALVKTGTSTVNLGATVANTYSAGTFVTSGVLNTTVNNAFGPASSPITLSGGTLQFNIPNASSSIALGGLGHNVRVLSNSQIIIDNGALAGVDNDLAFGGLSIEGPYTIGIRAFDSMDATFTGTHNFVGTPTIDLPQAASTSNPNTAANASVITLRGAITGSGFFVSSSGNTNDTAARLQIGGGDTDTTPNTYSGKVTILPGSNNEDLFVELNKAPNVVAITGDLQLDGGKVIPNFDNQIAASSNVTLNQGGIDFNGKNQTIASLTQNGGFVRTNFDGTATSNNTVAITGDYNFTGTDDFNAIAGSNFTSNGLDIGSNSTVSVGGTLRLNGYSRAVLGANQPSSS